MNYLFVGVDISKEVLDYAIVDQTHKRVVDQGQVENNMEGINEFIKQLKKLQINTTVWVCAEHTGRYGDLLVARMENKELRYSMVNSIEIIRSSGMVRGKSDHIDAKRIGTYAATHYHKLKPTTSPSQTIRKIKVLLTSRDQYVRYRTAMKNALKALEITSETLDLKKEIKCRKKEIKTLKQRVKDLEQEIVELIKSDYQLDENYQKTTQVTGVGPIAGAKFLVTTNNFTLFDNPRKFSCYCGLAPFEHTSGSSVKGKAKTSKLRNKDMKGIMFNAATSAIQYDQQLRTYYKRKIKQGKHKLSVINAVANKLVLRVFAVVNREKPYVNFSI